MGIFDKLFGRSRVRATPERLGAYLSYGIVKMALEGSSSLDFVIQRTIPPIQLDRDLRYHRELFAFASVPCELSLLNILPIPQVERTMLSTRQLLTSSARAQVPEPYRDRIDWTKWCILFDQRAQEYGLLVGERTIRFGLQAVTNILGYQHNDPELAMQLSGHFFAALQTWPEILSGYEIVA